MVLYVAVDRQRQLAKGVHLCTYLLTWIAGQVYGVRLCSVIKPYCYLLPVRSLCAIFVYSRDVP